MLPIHLRDFEAAGQWIHKARGGEQLRRWAHDVLRTYKPRGVAEAVAILASPLAQVLAADDPRGKLALATTISAAGIPVTVEGLSFFSQTYVDDIDVLVLEPSGWVPACIDCPNRPCVEPVARHLLRYWPC